MRNMILIFLVSLLTNCNCKKIYVSERTEAMLMFRGYAVLSTDSVFIFSHKKYVIKKREFFDEINEINNAVIWTEMGYEYHTKKEMLEAKFFFDDYGLSRSFEVKLIDDKHIKINSDTGFINAIDKKHKVIYYSLNSDKKIRGPIYIHRLHYR